MSIAVSEGSVHEQVVQLLALLCCVERCFAVILFTDKVLDVTNCICTAQELGLFCAASARLSI